MFFCPISQVRWAIRRVATPTFKDAGVNGFVHICIDAVAFFARLRVNWAVISWYDQRVGAMQELFIRVRYLPI